MTGRPIIGLTLDSEAPGGYASQPWYAIRENYCAAVVRGGGLPVLLPHEPDHAEALLEGIEAPGYRFCLGVQWHPEYALSRGDEAIFEALAGACAASGLDRLQA